MAQSENTYTRLELNEMIARMRSVSDTFYFGAVRTGCHPFLEICGLMNQYIALSERAAKEGTVNFEKKP